MNASRDIRVLICGSRALNLPFDVLNRIMVERGWKYTCVIISGGAIGPDTTAIEWAKANNIKYEVYKPRWDEFGNSAGILRNKEMVESCDVCLAFWDGKSKGTKFTIDYAKSLKKQVLVCQSDVEVEDERD